MSDTYLHIMVERIITMFAILALAVMTTVTAAHAAGMSAMPDQSAHAIEMMHAQEHGGLSCDDEEHCGSADAEMCEFVCAGLSVHLPSPVGDAGHAHGPASHDFPSEAIHVSWTPGLNERPPKLRLL